MKKRLTALLLALILLVSASAALASVASVGIKKIRTYEGQFADVLQSASYAADVQLAYEYGLIDGLSPARFAPMRELTVAEAVKLAACFHSAYNGNTIQAESGSRWYRPYADYALESGVIAADYGDYSKPATRGEMAAIFMHCLPKEALMEINTIEDGAIPDVPMDSRYAEEIYTLYRAGILTGNDRRGTFSPESSIKRAEIASIVVRMADDGRRIPFSPSDTGTQQLENMYDPDYDYSANPRYTVAYLTHTSSPIYSAYSEALEHWCTVMNMEYLGIYDAGGDTDMFLENVAGLAAKADGLFVDADPIISARCAEILEDSGTVWMPVLGKPYDANADDAVALHPYSSMDNYAAGSAAAKKLFSLKDELWPGVSYSDLGFITVDFSIAPALHQREQGARDTVAALHPELLDNYFEADCSYGALDANTASEAIQSIHKANPDIKHWLIFGEFDDFASGAAAATNLAGLDDTTAIVSIGGTALSMQWDAGQYDAFRAALVLPDTIFTAPIAGGLYAMLSGDATAETLWPQYVPEGEQYASLPVSAYWAEPDNYKALLKWSDIYSGANFYQDYPSAGITADTYSATDFTWME